MIICKTPLRLSFLGGGTDLPIFINKNGYGCVISSTINKYIYITIKEHGELFSENIRLNYSNTETVSKISMVRNDIIRETLKFLKIKKKFIFPQYRTSLQEVDWVHQVLLCWSFAGSL